MYPKYAKISMLLIQWQHGALGQIKISILSAVASTLAYYQSS